MIRTYLPEIVYTPYPPPLTPLIYRKPITWIRNGDVWLVYVRTVDLSIYMVVMGIFEVF